VGYVDDDTVPGGGFFIVRNSWGAAWAADSPEGAGHALMPFEYVERFAVESFTGEIGAARPESPPSDDYESRFVSVLAEDGRDMEGRLLSSGTCVSANPTAPHEFMEDTSGNRQRFVAGHHAWTAETRSAEWFPRLRDLPDSFQEDLSKCEAAKQNFMTAIEENVRASVGRPFPHIRTPFFVALLPWQQRIKRAEAVDDGTDALVQGMLLLAGCPEDAAVPAAWETALASVNGLKLFKVSSAHAEFVVTAAFVSPIRFADGPSLCVSRWPT
jgi:hypothetical protein